MGKLKLVKNIIRGMETEMGRRTEGQRDGPNIHSYCFYYVKDRRSRADRQMDRGNGSIHHIHIAFTKSRAITQNPFIR